MTEPTSEGDVLTCPMCGEEIPDPSACHGSCPMAGDCAQVCCPRCGYSITDPSRTTLGRWLQRLLGREER